MIYRRSTMGLATVAIGAIVLSMGCEQQETVDLAPIYVDSMPLEEEVAVTLPERDSRTLFTDPADSEVLPPPQSFAQNDVGSAPGDLDALADEPEKPKAADDPFGGLSFE